MRAFHFHNFLIMKLWFGCSSARDAPGRSARIFVRVYTYARLLPFSSKGFHARLAAGFLLPAFQGCRSARAVVAWAKILEGFREWIALPALHRQRSICGWIEHSPRSRLSATNAWPLASIPSRAMSILQTVVHRLAADQHHSRGLFLCLSYVRLGGAAQIYLPGDNGDDHNDGADAEDPDHELKVSRHGNCRIAGVIWWRDYTRMSRRDATPVAGLTAPPFSP